MRGRDAERVHAHVKQLEDRRTWSRDRLVRFQARRLEMILSFAARRSPYYRELLGEGRPRLEAFPPMTKQTMVLNFDRIVTAKVEYADVLAFAEGTRKSRRLRFLCDRYAVVSTGGTSGRNLFVVRDREIAALQSAVILSRLYRENVDRRGRLRLALVAGSLPIHGSVFQALFLPANDITRRVLPPDAKLVTAAESLRSFAPNIITGYPSSLAAIAALQEEGKSAVRPALVCCVGEYLSTARRRRIATAFHCPVRALYACTEIGPVAAECREGRLHIAEDVVLAEVVDASNAPVRDGELGTRVLLTNLWNRTLPTLRYQVEDRIRLGAGPCKCGSAHRWIAEIGGRQGAMLEVARRGGGSVSIAGWELVSKLWDVPDIAGAQGTSGAKGELTVRVVPHERADPTSLRIEVRRLLEKHLTQTGADPRKVRLTIEFCDSLERNVSSGKAFDFRAGG